MALNKTTSNTIIGLESIQTISNSTFSEKSFLNLFKPFFGHYLGHPTRISLQVEHYADFCS